MRAFKDDVSSKNYDDYGLQLYKHNQTVVCLVLLNQGKWINGQTRRHVILCPISEFLDDLLSYRNCIIANWIGGMKMNQILKTDLSSLRNTVCPLPF